MQKYFDFQMFDENPVLSIPGIDADVLAELSEEENLTGCSEGSQDDTTAHEDRASEEVDPYGEAAAAGEEDSTGDAAENTEEGDPNADADSDNKQVGEQPKGNIPYVRFKQELDKRKAVEEELAALKAKLEQPSARSPQVLPGNQESVQQQPVNVQQIPNKVEVMKAVTTEAIRRAKAQMGLTDDDLAGMEFADNLEAKTQFNVIVQQETNSILETARRNAQERAEFENEVQAATKDFTDFVNGFQALPDAAERWDFIANQKFLELTPVHQKVIKAAFDRLQNKRGTSADFIMAKSYFDKAAEEYDAVHQVPSVKPPAAKPAIMNVAAKVEAAQALPKSPQVGGTGKTATMSAEEVARILNEPGSEALDKLPPDVLKKVMMGIPLE